MEPPSYISHYLPKALLTDLSITEDTTLESKDDSFPLSKPFPKRSTSHQSLPSFSPSSPEDPLSQHPHSLGFQSSSHPFATHPFTALSFDDILHDSTYSTIFLSMLSTRTGSQYLQRKLCSSASPSADIDIILAFLIHSAQSIASLLCDAYANYFMQQLISQANALQRIRILSCIRDDFCDIAKDVAGTHCLQKLVENVTEGEEEDIVKSCLMRANMYAMCTEVNTCHVVYRLVDGKKLKQRKYLFTFVRQNLAELAKTVNGSAIVKKLFAEVTSGKMIRKIVKILEMHFFDLAQNQFGNYVIQDAIEKFGCGVCKGLVLCVIKHSFNFALQKYASNVIDRIAIILRRSNECVMFNQLINVLFMEKNNLGKLLQNKFGTFVVKNILNMLTFQEKHFLYQYCNLNTIFSNV